MKVNKRFNWSDFCKKYALRKSADIKLLPDPSFGRDIMTSYCTLKGGRKVIKHKLGCLFEQEKIQDKQSAAFKCGCTGCVVRFHLREHIVPHKESCIQASNVC